MPNTRAAAFWQSATEVGVEGLITIATSTTTATSMADFCFNGLSDLTPADRAVTLAVNRGLGWMLDTSEVKEFALAHWLTSGASGGRLFVRVFDGAGMSARSERPLMAALRRADRVTFGAAGWPGRRLSPVSVGVRAVPDGQRREAISVVQRRRRWTTEQKLALVEEAMRPGSSVAGLAARHGLSRSLLFDWRRQAREGTMPGVVRADAGATLVLGRGLVSARPLDQPHR